MVAAAKSNEMRTQIWDRWQRRPSPIRLENPNFPLITEKKTTRATGIAEIQDWDEGYLPIHGTNPINQQPHGRRNESGVCRDWTALRSDDRKSRRKIIRTWSGQSPGKERWAISARVSPSPNPSLPLSCVLGCSSLPLPSFSNGG